MKPQKKAFSEGIPGKETSLYVLTNGSIEVAITNYGARIVALYVPDREKKPTDVVTGFSTLQEYLDAKETYHGTIVGRYANRIAKGRFTLNGKTYQLAINNAPNHLHGGPKGFHNQVWKVEENNERTLHLSYFSPDGEENYPGNLTVHLTYTLSDNNELGISYEASTDAATVINLTSHPFFNLNGQGNGPVTEHELWIDADRYNPVDKNLIPTGIAKVEGTAFDFRGKRTIGRDIERGEEQLKFGAGYDHNFVLNGSGFRPVGRARGDRSGIVMEVLTDQPGMQLYSGNFMKSEHTIKYGLKDVYRGAFCLETQHFPDSPNQPSFPNTVLQPGDVFRSRTVYRFSNFG